MKISRTLVITSLVLSAFASSCEVARASPSPSEFARAGARSAAIEAYEARKSGSLPMEELAADSVSASACAEGLVPWRRMADVELCTSACTSDVDCAWGERCRVLHFDGIEHRPDSPPLYADDMPEVFEAYDAERALLDDGFVLDDPPVCEGECSGAPGLPIQAVPPTALCDPLFDVNE